jgi:acyl carrier protein
VNILAIKVISIKIQMPLAGEKHVKPKETDRIIDGEIEISDVKRILLEFNPSLSTTPLSNDTDLLTSGILGSLQILEFVEALEQGLSLEIDPIDINLENFKTLAAIHDLVISSTKKNESS